MKKGTTNKDLTRLEGYSSRGGWSNFRTNDSVFLWKSIDACICWNLNGEKRYQLECPRTGFFRLLEHSTGIIVALSFTEHIYFFDRSGELLHKEKASPEIEDSNIVDLNMDYKLLELSNGNLLVTLHDHFTIWSSSQELVHVSKKFPNMINETILFDDERFLVNFHKGPVTIFYNNGLIQKRLDLKFDENIVSISKLSEKTLCSISNNQIISLWSTRGCRISQKMMKEKPIKIFPVSNNRLILSTFNGAEILSDILETLEYIDGQRLILGVFEISNSKYLIGYSDRYVYLEEKEGRIELNSEVLLSSSLFKYHRFTDDTLIIENGKTGELYSLDALNGESSELDLDLGGHVSKIIPIDRSRMIICMNGSDAFWIDNFHSHIK